MLEGMIYDPDTNRIVNGLNVRDQFPNNKIPASRFDPVAVKIQALFPQPNGPTPNGLVNNYLNAYTTTRTTEVPSVKIDQTIGTKGKLSFFWQQTKTANPNGNTIFGRSDGLPDPLTAALGTFQNAPLYRLNYDHTLSPTLLLHWAQATAAIISLFPRSPPRANSRTITQSLNWPTKAASRTSGFRPCPDSSPPTGPAA